jgi:hypothetical protein
MLCAIATSHQEWLRPASTDGMDSFRVSRQFRSRRLSIGAPAPSAGQDSAAPRDDALALPRHMCKMPITTASSSPTATLRLLSLKIRPPPLDSSRLELEDQQERIPSAWPWLPHSPSEQAPSSQPPWQHPLQPCRSCKRTSAATTPEHSHSPSLPICTVLDSLGQNTSDSITLLQWPYTCED